MLYHVFQVYIVSLTIVFGEYRRSTTTQSRMNSNKINLDFCIWVWIFSILSCIHIINLEQIDTANQKRPLALCIFSFSLNDMYVMSKLEYFFCTFQMLLTDTILLPSVLVCRQSTNLKSLPCALKATTTTRVRVKKLWNDFAQVKNASYAAFSHYQWLALL